MPKSYTNQEIIEYFVCGECGGKLGLITIEDECEQAWCPRCQKTHTGVMPEVYEIAFAYCNEHSFNYYSDMDFYNEDPLIVKQLNMGKMCGIAEWIIRRLEKGGNE